MVPELIGPIGIIAALNWETDGFARCPDGKSGLIFETVGPGPAAAATGARQAVARGAACLISWGTAGALRSGEPGEIVLADCVLDESLQVSEPNSSLTRTLARIFQPVAPIHRGRLASVSEPVTSIADKHALAEASGAIAVDMESAAIADVCSRSGVPMAVVRVIVDRCDRAVPEAAIAGMDGSRTRPGRVLTGLLKSPRDIAALVSLGLAARRARRTLRACAARLASQLDKQ